MKKEDMAAWSDLELARYLASESDEAAQVALSEFSVRCNAAGNSSGLLTAARSAAARAGKLKHAAVFIARGGKVIRCLTRHGEVCAKCSLLRLSADLKARAKR